MKTLKLVGLGLLLTLGSTLFAGTHAMKRANGHKWEKLGTKIVNMKADHDVINVTYQEGVFSKVKFTIRKAPIHLLNINIIFGNGENKNIVFNKNFTAGSTTRIIDLPGNKRIIKKINLNYKSVPVGKGRAVVIAWGKH